MSNKTTLRTFLLAFALQLLSVISPAQDTLSSGIKGSAKSGKAVKARMMKAFGGKRHLEKIDYITYSLSRKVFKDGDTISTQQLWYVHMQKPLVVKLDIHGQDTVASLTSSHTPKSLEGSNEASAAAEELLRSRFFNFLYLLTAPEAGFTYVKKEMYKNRHVDIVRVTNRLNPAMSLDLFVNSKGEVITSSTPIPASGTYKRFGDEYRYEKVAGKITFPLQYKVVQQDRVLVEGFFSDIEINKLSSFWERRLALLNVKQ